MTSYGIPGTRVVAYTYEADYHCTDCTDDRFGTDEHGYPPESARDGEGNEIHPVFVTDLDVETVAMCSDCGKVICLSCGDTDSLRPVGENCWNCRTGWRTES
jgi:hypothetical protein